MYTPETVQENTLQKQAQKIIGQVRRVIVGKDQSLLWILATVLAKGHILLEDIPGVGKTTMAVAFSKVLNLSYNRVQFTPDVLPSDVTGYSVPDAAGNLRYQPGAILCNLFLADELNRATSRTQSALLEAMEEGQVTVDGVSHPLPAPFVVIATQNPTGAAGTQLLPDSQMDRFTIRMSLGYPAPGDEVAMVMNRLKKNPMAELPALFDRETLIAMQEAVSQTHVEESVVEYAVQLISATRCNANILRGASPRATLSVIAVSKAIAQLRGRDYVIPRDVKEVFLKVVPHRLLLTPKAEGSGITAENVLSVIASAVPAPQLR